MTSDYILIALAAATFTLLLSWFFFNKERQAKNAEIKEHIAEARELD